MESYPHLELENYSVPRPGPPNKSREGTLSRIAFVLFTSASLWLLIQYNLIPWANSEYSVVWKFWVWLHVAYFCLLYFMVMSSFYITQKNPAAVVTDGWVPDRRAVDPLAEDRKIRFCNDCQNWQPPRAHHCGECKRCVLKQDHHSAFFGCCIGFGNLKPYTLFYFYSGVYFICVSFVTFWWVLMSILGYEFERCDWNGFGTTCSISLTISLLTLVPAVITIMKALSLYQGAMSNVTQQEIDKFFDREFQIWPYFVSVATNLASVLGRDHWFSPFHRAIPGDGIRFELSEEWKSLFLNQLP